jgi:release factor glutamine methyltransferase
VRTSSTTVSGLLASGIRELQIAGVDTPKLDAELLLVKASGLNRTEILTHPDLTLSSTVTKQYLAYLSRRFRREPLAYITGERYFYDLLLHVTPDVLVPRQETEVLVEAALSISQGYQSPTIIDIGVGSGAIALAIAKHAKNATVFGTDTSAGALAAASANAEGYQNVTFALGDLFDPFPDIGFDLVVSNPPYIPSADIASLQPEVASYEPHQALDGGADGLDAYRRLIPESAKHLKIGGSLAVEIGIGESNSVMQLCAASGFSNIRSILDYAGIERVVTAIYGSKEPHES